MTKITCPHCSKDFSVEDGVFQLNPQEALLELIIARFALIYRSELKIALPFDGEKDLRAMKKLIAHMDDEDSGMTIEAISDILGHWLDYVYERGSESSVREFSEFWLSEDHTSDNVIPFKPR